MDKKEAQIRVNHVAKVIREKEIVFRVLQDQIEEIAKEVNDLRNEVLVEIDEAFDWDEYSELSRQMDADWLPSSYVC